MAEVLWILIWALCWDWAVGLWEKSLGEKATWEERFAIIFAWPVVVVVYWLDKTITARQARG